MLKSMTAYGRSSLVTPNGRFVAEVKSLNRKFLDISISTQKGLSCFESDIRNWVSSQINRGKVDVSIWATFEGSSPVKVTPNLALAKEIQGAWDQLAEALDLDDRCDLKILQQEPGILIYEENVEDLENLRKTIKEAIDLAMEGVLKMKTVEGAALQKDIENRLRKMGSWIEQIEQKGDCAVQKYRDKLIQRISELTPEVNDDRILKEIALYAERIDISEEIIRFKSHIKQFDQYLASESEGIGKTLEFLVQELLREANTIGSKSQDVEISRTIVEIKSEIERVREQIQNVE
jgi:uncharacterized protein (TIGR00255 family)